MVPLEFFSDIILPVTLALGLTQPLTEMSIARVEPDESCAETRFRLSEKRTSPFESAGVSFQSSGRRLCVHIVSWGRLLSVANTLITVWKCRWKAGRSM
jgi:hypothetical protein